MYVDFRGISQNIYPQREKTIQTNISSQKQKFKNENKKAHIKNVDFKKLFLKAKDTLA